MSTASFEVMLEKKGRGRGFALARPWAVRTFKLKQQQLDYYDSAKLKGSINVAGGKASVVSSKEADDKPFPFVFDASTGERLFMNATCDSVRQRCIQIFNLAAQYPDWGMPPEPGHQTAAAQAVIGTLSAEVEKNKLLEEQKRLEEERQKEVAAATARMMEEEAANAKLRQAEEAARQEQEAQQRRLVQMLKGMSAKTRFFAAKKEGQVEIATEAAAIMVQGAWRCKLAARKVVLKRAEKEALRREACARKIQCRYRIRVAKRRIAAIKAEKKRNAERLAAIKLQCALRQAKARRLYREKKLLRIHQRSALIIQCACRIMLAYKEVKRRLDNKMAEQVNKSISRQRRIISMQSMVRRFLAVRRAAKRRIAYPMVVQVRLGKTDGYKHGDAEIGAIVSGLVLALPASHPALVNPSHKISIDTIKSVGRVTSHFRVDSLAHVQTVIATALNQVDFVVVTLLDKSSSAAKDDFIGQAIVRVSDVLHSKNPEEFTATVHLEWLVQILDAEQKPLAQVRANIRNHATSASPCLTLGLRVAPSATSSCGWLWKVSEAFLSNAWKRRWFVLMDGHLTYYNSDLALEASKNTIACASVISLTEDTFKGRHAWKITFTVNGAESFWQLDFDENESHSIKEMWLRKIRRCCPALATDEPRGVSKPASSPQNVKTKLPVSRRVSVFK